MNSLLQAVFECITGTAGDSVRLDNAPNDKNYFEYKGDEKVGRTAQDIATDVVNALYSAEKSGRDLEKKLNDIVGEYGWVENIGVAILNALEVALKEGAVMGQAMKEAAEKAAEAATDFQRDHPVYSTIIALGILVLLSPWVLEAIGFGELGPIEGTFASWWQSRYAGYVPKNSLFSFFQRLGMKLGKKWV